MKIIYHIYELHTERHMSERALAAKSGVSKSEINNIENDLKHPTVYTLCLLSLALDICGQIPISSSCRSRTAAFLLWEAIYYLRVKVREKHLTQGRITSLVKRLANLGRMTVKPDSPIRTLTIGIYGRRWRGGKRTDDDPPAC